MIAPYTPAALRAVLATHSLTGAQAGRLLGVNSRTIRKWTAGADVDNHREMPASAWWLLLILVGDITAKQLLAHVQTQPESPE